MTRRLPPEWRRGLGGAERGPARAPRRRLYRRHDRPLSRSTNTAACSTPPRICVKGALVDTRRTVDEHFRRSSRPSCAMRRPSRDARARCPPVPDSARVVVEPPRDASHGDLATNAAMVLAKEAGLNPRALAELIAARWPGSGRRVGRGGRAGLHQHPPARRVCRDFVAVLAARRRRYGRVAAAAAKP